MKKTIQLYLYLVFCALWAISCSENDRDIQYQISAGHWGHLTGLTDTLPSKMYLSHLKRNEPYKICIANYMIQKYPGIENEIKAAINIWGHYISREIRVEFTRTDLPVADEYTEEEIVMEDYYNRCPKEIHLVVGQSHLTDYAAGATILSYKSNVSAGKKEVKSFQRALFLKEPLTPEEVEKEDESTVDVKMVWKSLAQVMGKELTDKEILELMKKRDKKLFLTGKHELLTFKTIVHEFGHIWGLCDQYALGGNETNCDVKFATINEEGHINLHDEAMMAKSSWVAKLFLEDDDIEGIRKLAERKEFTHDWPKATVFRATKVNKPAPGRPIELAEIRSAVFADRTVKLDLTLVTNVSPLTLTARVFDKIKGTWLTFGETPYNKALTDKSRILKLKAGRTIIPTKVKLSLKYKDKKTTKKVIIELEAPVTNFEKSDALENDEI